MRESRCSTRPASPWNQRMKRTRCPSRIAGGVALAALVLALTSCAGHRIRAFGPAVRRNSNCNHTLGEDCRCRPDPWSHGYTVWQPLIPACLEEGKIETGIQPEIIPPGTEAQSRHSSAGMSYKAALQVLTKTAPSDRVVSETIEPETIEEDAEQDAATDATKREAAPGAEQEPGSSVKPEPPAEDAGDDVAGDEALGDEVSGDEEKPLDNPPPAVRVISKPPPSDMPSPAEELSDLRRATDSVGSGDWPKRLRPPPDRRNRSF